MENRMPHKLFGFKITNFLWEAVRLYFRPLISLDRCFRTSN